MSLSPEERDAVRVHTEQAALFRDRYEALPADPYGSCFAYTRYRLQSYLDRLLPAAAPGARLLDLGCGTGHHLEWARGRGYAVAGTDGSEAMLAEARRLNPEADLRVAPVDSVSFTDASFDAVLCIEVLRYLPDVAPCLREMARVLKPGGVAVVTASPLFNVNGYPLFNRAALRVRWGRAVRLRQYFHTSPGLRRQFRAAGFHDVATHGVYMGVINWAERVSPSRLGGFLRAFESVDARITDLPGLRDLSAMLLVHARR